MSEENQEGQKTVVSFIVGLLIGGLLVWAFSGPAVDAPEDSVDEDKVEKTESKSDKDADTKDKTDEDAKGATNAKVDEGSVAVERTTLPVGDGSVVVNDQPASKSITMERATYPISEGWIGVRDYQNGQLGRILGVVRFSEEQGLVPSSIELLTPTVAGREYAVVIFEESGDRKFSLADDVQVDKIFDTFTATAK